MIAVLNSWVHHKRLMFLWDLQEWLFRAAVFVGKSFPMVTAAVV